MSLSTSGIRRWLWSYCQAPLDNGQASQEVCFKPGAQDAASACRAAWIAQTNINRVADPSKNFQTGTLLMSTHADSWDLATALRDMSADLAKHVHASTLPASNELENWLDYINNAARVYWTLENACEDLIEDGATEARVQALKEALSHAQGQSEYWPRKDRW